MRITLTDQTDAKLLLGTYVTDKPGSFTWRAGILTTAVKEGKWIVIEDIERAGNDVLSVLLPLLEGRPLELAGRGQIEMAKGCQIVATTRSPPFPPRRRVGRSVIPTLMYADFSLALNLRM